MGLKTDTLEEHPGLEDSRKRRDSECVGRTMKMKLSGRRRPERRLLDVVREDHVVGVTEEDEEDN